MPQQQAEYMTCTPLRDKRQIPLAPRAPSIHEPVEGRAASSKRASTSSARGCRVGPAKEHGFGSAESQASVARRYLGPGHKARDDNRARGPSPQVLREILEHALDRVGGRLAQAADGSVRHHL